MEISITLEGLLSVIDTSKAITVNLYQQAAEGTTGDLLLISFGLPGYDCLDDFLLDDEVTKIVIKSVNTIDVTIDTSLNA